MTEIVRWRPLVTVVRGTDVARGLARAETISMRIVDEGCCLPSKPFDGAWNVVVQDVDEFLR